MAEDPPGRCVPIERGCEGDASLPSEQSGSSPPGRMLHLTQWEGRGRKSSFLITYSVEGTVIVLLTDLTHFSLSGILKDAYFKVHKKMHIFKGSHGRDPDLCD